MSGPDNGRTLVVTGSATLVGAPRLDWLEQLCDPLGAYPRPLQLPAWRWPGLVIEPHVLVRTEAFDLVHRGVLDSLVQLPLDAEEADSARHEFWLRTVAAWQTFTLAELRAATVLPPPSRRTCPHCHGRRHDGIVTEDMPALSVAGETAPTEPFRTWAPVLAKTLGRACARCGGTGYEEGRGDGIRQAAGVKCDIRDVHLVLERVADTPHPVTVLVDHEIQQVCLATPDWRVRFSPIEYDHTVPELGATT